MRKALTRIAELRGVGPATAAAILSLYDSRIPFMGDEAIGVTQVHNVGLQFAGLSMDLSAKTSDHIR